MAATEGGDVSQGGVLSYLPGQRLSRCTCPGESHPGPIHSDGTYVGRAAPEIDIFEAQVGNHFFDILYGVEIGGVIDYGNSSHGPGVTVCSVGGWWVFHFPDYGLTKGSALNAAFQCGLRLGKYLGERSDP